jgi:Cadherin domain/Putative Ig domain
VNRAPEGLLLDNALALDSGAGSSFGVISASDRNAGSVLTFSLEGPNANLFHVDPSSGALEWVGDSQLDVGVGVVAFDVGLRVKDEHGSSMARTVRVSVEPVNDDVSAFSVVVNPLAENSAGVVARFSVVDPDPGETFTYSLTGHGAELFDVDPLTGTVSLVAGVSYEDVAAFDLLLTVTDSSGHVKSSALAINVVDVNEPFTVDFISSELFAWEGMTAGQTVGSLTLLDPDAGETFSVSGLPSFLEWVDGNIVVVGPLPPDAESRILALQVLDSKGEFSRTVEIELKVFRPPVGEDVAVLNGIIARGIRLNENSHDITDVANFQAVQIGDVGKITWSLTDPYGLFQIDSETGHMFYNGNAPYGNPDFETNQTFTVLVTAVGERGEPRTIPWTVRLQDVVEAPIFNAAGQSTFSASEGTETSFLASASASEGGGHLTYSFVGPSPEGFSIDSATGSINGVVPDFDKPGGGVTTFYVRATNELGEKTEKVFTLMSLNVNEHPLFDNGKISTDASGNVSLNSSGPMSNLTLKENYNGRILDIKFSDPDVGDSLTYAIVGENNPGFFTLIDRGNGTVSVATKQGYLDYETSPKFYDLTVRATDKDGLFVDHSVHVDLKNVNEGSYLSLVYEGFNGPYDPRGLRRLDDTHIGFYFVVSNDPEGDPIHWSTSNFGGWTRSLEFVGTEYRDGQSSYAHFILTHGKPTTGYGDAEFSVTVHDDQGYSFTSFQRFGV